MTMHYLNNGVGPDTGTAISESVKVCEDDGGLNNEAGSS